MGTESGLEEFVLWVQHDFVSCEIRADWESDWEAPYGLGISRMDGTIVKAYASHDWQFMAFNLAWESAVIIGYCERRLTDIEEAAIRRYVARYWEIPF